MCNPHFSLIQVVKEMLLKLFTIDPGWVTFKEKVQSKANIVNIKRTEFKMFLVNHSLQEKIIFITSHFHKKMVFIPD